MACVYRRVSCIWAEGVDLNDVAMNIANNAFDRPPYVEARKKFVIAADVVGRRGFPIPD